MCTSEVQATGLHGSLATVKLRASDLLELFRAFASYRNPFPPPSECMTVSIIPLPGWSWTCE